MANSAGIILGIIEAKSIEPHSASIIEHFVSISFKNGSIYFGELFCFNSEKASQTTIAMCRLMIADMALMVQGPKSAHFLEHSVSILDFVLRMLELPHRNCSI